MLPTTGRITLADVNRELGRPVNAPITLNDPAVRALAGVPDGKITLGNLRGKLAPA